MSGIYEVTVQEARGFVAVEADLDRLAVVMGCASLGSGLSPFYLSGTSAVAGVGYGDAADILTTIIEQPQDSGTARKFPAAIYRTPITTEGSYGTIDVSGVTGTVVASFHAATKPYGTYEPYFRIVNGGMVGTDGITYVWSLNNGRDVSNVTALGTATTITIPNSNVQVDLSPASADLTALNTRLNEIKTDYEAHRILTAGTVHGAADATNAITAANASDSATRIALANDLRAKFNGHRILTSGGVHGAADATNVITAPVATDDASALILALDITTKYEAHRILTASSVHGAADNTNAVTSPAPSAGAFAAGDIVKGRTFAPAPSTTDVDAAFTALKNASIDFSLLFCDFPVDATMFAHITSGLNTLLTAGKRVTAICRTRLPDFEASEAEEDWGVSIIGNFPPSVSDSRILMRAAYTLTKDAMTSRQYRRSNLAQFAADVVRIGRADFPDAPADRKMAGASIVDANGVALGHDEGPRGAFTGLSNDTLGNRFCSDMRLPDYARREDVYSTVPWVMYAADERIRNLPTRRIANAMERVAVAAGNAGLGGRLFYTPAVVGVPGSVPRLTPASRAAIHASIYSPLKSEFATDIQNADAAGLDTGLVQVNPVITLSGGNLVKVAVTLAPLVFGYLLSLDLTLAVQQ
jgi:hypothetical protein